MSLQKHEYWKIRFKLIGETFYPIGGGKGEPAPPQAPTVIQPSETSAQAIQAQIDALPKILASQQQFGPQFQQLELQQAQEFGPQWTEYGLGLAEQYGGRLSEIARAEQEVLAPERVAGSQAIADYLQAGPEALSPEEQRDMLGDVRAAQSVRGLAYSGMATVDELKKITGLRQALKDRYLNVALSASGRLPAQGSSSVAAPNTSTQQLVQNVDPATFFGGQNAAMQAASSIYNTQGSIYGSQLSNQSSPLGSILGGVAGGLTGGFSTGLGLIGASAFGRNQGWTT